MEMVFARALIMNNKGSPVTIYLDDNASPDTIQRFWFEAEQSIKNGQEYTKFGNKLSKTSEIH
jgi:hypothetical protein